MYQVHRGVGELTLLLSTAHRRKADIDGISFLNLLSCRRISPLRQFHFLLRLYISTSNEDYVVALSVEGYS